jgi:heavy metal efflux system protein
MSGVKGANSVKIVGPNLDTLTALANRVQDQMAQVRGITDLGIFPVLGQPNLDITVNRVNAARYGLNSGDVNTLIQAALGGTVATTVLEADRQFDLVVRFASDARDDIDKVRNIKVGVQTPSGATAFIPLSELATISLDNGASWIYHESTQRYIPVKFSVRGRDLAGAVGEAQDRIAHHVTLPSGYRLVWAGEFGELQAAERRLAVIIPISLLLIFGILYALFNSLRYSLLALCGIPFAAAGGIVALYVAGLHFSISAGIGFISLFGVAVMHGVLMITYYETERQHGAAPVDAVFNAASTRMRPLLMTAFSACIGLFPAAISTAIGSQVQRPLATVVVGGMLIGPVVLLLVVPALQAEFLAKDVSPPEAASA